MLNAEREQIYEETGLYGAITCIEGMLANFFYFLSFFLSFFLFFYFLSTFFHSNFIDLEPASLAHLANQKVLNVVDMLAKIDQDNYPECLRKVYLINSTKIFSMIWNIIQYFFDENTKAKFSFYGIVCCFLSLVFVSFTL
jgi:hypothetical protein